MDKKYVFRVAVCLSLIFSIAIFSVGRIAVLSADESLKALADNNCLKITVENLRGTIYDCNMQPITNRNRKILAVILPTKQAKATVREYISQDDLNEVYAKLEDNRPAVVFVDSKFACDGVKFFDINTDKNSEQIATHILGYVNAEQHGVTGIQKAFDDLLHTNKKITVEIPCQASGKAILSAEADINYDMTAQNNGVITTLDYDIQKIAEEAAKAISSGAVVITEVGSGKIRAMVSRPDYSPKNVYKYLNDESKPLINRALSAYNVGSVFKPCIAASLKSFELSEFECTGSLNVDGRTFNCNKLDGHGKIGVTEAIAFSCNCYFYNLAVKSDGKNLYDIASALHFGRELKLAEGITMQGGVLTNKNSLIASKQSRANFGIGQGDLLLSPLALSMLYEAVATGGEYHLPALIEGTVSNGQIIKGKDQSLPIRAFSKQTAELIANGLEAVLREGTGKLATPEFISAAGKTATAQTGWIKDGKKVTHGWFCGYFPKENPQYVCVVLCEGATSGGSVCAPIFQRIADGIYQSGKIK